MAHRSRIPRSASHFSESGEMDPDPGGFGTTTTNNNNNNDNDINNSNNSNNSDNSNNTNVYISIRRVFLI